MRISPIQPEVVDLVTDVAPDVRYAGGQVLEKLIVNSPTLRFDVTLLAQGNLQPPPSGENWNYVHRSHIGILSAFSLLIKGVRLAFQIRSSPSDVCWLVLQGPRLAVVYLPIFLFGKKRIVLHQWDPIEWWMQNLNSKPFRIRIMRKLTSWMAKKADVNIVPSDNWKKHIESSGGRAIRVDNFFFESELATHFADRALPALEFHAVFVGGLYAASELFSLTDSLVESARVFGKKPILHYFGNDDLSELNAKIEIRQHGFLSRNELVEQLPAFDCALLPYPQAAEFQSTSELSFPSKSRIYVAAGLPILANCAAISSPNVFFAKNLRPYFFNLQTDSGLPAFLELCSADQKRGEIRFAVTETARKHFSAAAELVAFQAAMASPMERP